jgi:hypothetical protein
MANFERMYKDLKYSRDRNITKSSFIVDFNAISNTTPEVQRTFIFDPPIDLIVNTIELEVVSSGSTATVTVSSNNPLFQSKSVSVTNVAGNRAYLKISNPITALSSSSTTFIVTSTAAVSSVKLNIGIISQRLTKKSFLSSLLSIEAGTTLANLVSTLNSAFSSYETEVLANTNNQDDIRVEVITIRENTAVGITREQTRIPSTGKKFDSIKCYLCCAVGSNLFVKLLDENSSTIASSTVSGSGTTSTTKQVISVTDTQTLDDLDTAASDYEISVSRDSGVGTINWFYAVIYYK